MKLTYQCNFSFTNTIDIDESDVPEEIAMNDSVHKGILEAVQMKVEALRAEHTDRDLSVDVTDMIIASNTREI